MLIYKTKNAPATRLTRLFNKSSVMKTNLKVASIALFFALAPVFTSCVATVRTPPPPARVEIIPRGPSPRHVWVPGHYVRRGRNYVWVNGFYTVNRRRY